MLALALTVSFIALTSSNDCRWECDMAFANYAYNVCWVQQYYSNAPVLNEECVTNCISTSTQCLEDNGCFNQENTWCDSWSCDCSYQCDYYSQCYDKVYEDGLCEFQNSCYDACPEESNQEEEDDNCVETYCYDELAACANEENCVNAVEGIISDCYINIDTNMDSVQCVEAVQGDPDQLLSYCGGGDDACFELFESLASCVVTNQCHQENEDQEGKTSRKLNFAESVKQYKRRKESIKRKVLAKRQRDQRNKQLRQRELKKKREQKKSLKSKSAFSKYSKRRQ